MKKISVIVPVYYNEKSLPLLFEELLRVEYRLREMDMQLELIFVDDGSGDDSLGILLEFRQLHQNVHVIKHSRNFGAFHAIKSGFQFVTGDCFTMLSADLQDPPSLILEMVQKWLNGSKYVVCARTDRDDPVSSKVFAAIYYKLLRWMVMKNYPSGGFDMALMDRIFLSHLQNSSKNVHISLFAYWLGFKPHVIPYERQKRRFGKSRWTYAKRIKLFLDSLLGFSIVPIRLISLVGFVVSFISFIYGIIIFMNCLLGKTDVQGFSSLAVLISFLLGIIMVMLGVIGEYLWRILDEVNKRPEAVIEEIY
jgi:polyisoprenyl-phosphate glycosyltransferase